MQDPRKAATIVEMILGREEKLKLPVKKPVEKPLKKPESPESTTKPVEGLRPDAPHSRRGINVHSLAIGRSLPDAANLFKEIYLGMT